MLLRWFVQKVLSLFYDTNYILRCCVKAVMCSRLKIHGATAVNNPDRLFFFLSRFQKVIVFLLEKLHLLQQGQKLWNGSRTSCCF